MSNRRSTYKSIVKIVNILNNSLSSQFYRDFSLSKEMLRNYRVKKRISGFNNSICILEYCNEINKSKTKLCLKYTRKGEIKNELLAEFTIMKILQAHGILCPKLYKAGSLDDISYIYMDAIDGKCVDSHVVSIKVAESVLDAILLHESILLNNLNKMQSLSLVSDYFKVIDYNKKLDKYIKVVAPDVVFKNEYDFIGDSLNSKYFVENRTIVTDRSVENIFINQYNQIMLIDFSTLRIGTQFDNWIQFIEDPRIIFSCTKKDLIKLFFKKKKLSLTKEIKYYYYSSIYTNLLQGIFTFQKNPKLALKYFDTVNDSYKKLTKKKGVLIGITN